MAEFQEEVTRSIFPAGYRLGRPHEGTGDRHLKFALYDEEMRPLGDRIYTLTISGEVRDERGDLKVTDQTLVQKLEEIETLLGSHIAALVGQ